MKIILLILLYLPHGGSLPWSYIIRSCRWIYVVYVEGTKKIHIQLVWMMKKIMMIKCSNLMNQLRTPLLAI